MSESSSQVYLYRSLQLEVFRFWPIVRVRELARIEQRLELVHYKNGIFFRYELVSSRSHFGIVLRRVC